jgi:hypothetical protein
VESAASGGADIQVTGQCSSQTAASVHDWLLQLAASGWSGGLQAGGRVYHFRRGTTELTALFSIHAVEPQKYLQAFTVLQRQIATQEP